MSFSFAVVIRTFEAVLEEMLGTILIFTPYFLASVVIIIGFLIGLIIIVWPLTLLIMKIGKVDR